MNVIELSKKTIEKLTLLPIPKDIFNNEALIYNFEYRKKQLLIKQLYQTKCPSFANKLYTIKMLNTYKQYISPNIVIPDSLITTTSKNKYQNEIIGFTLPKIDGINLQTIINSPDIDSKHKIFYLKQIGNILEDMKKVRQYSPLKDFFINDLHEANFIVNINEKQLYSIDVDSYKISNNQTFIAKYLSPIGLISKAVKGKYPNENYNYIISENTDLYCYIIVILRYLFCGNINNMSVEEYYKYLTYLNDINIDKELLDIFYNILSPKKNINPAPYLDTLTFEQLKKANTKIYSLIQK